MPSPTYLITGATDGIGKATALALAERGAGVIVHGRNPAKLEATLAELRSATGNRSLVPVHRGFVLPRRRGGTGRSGAQGIFRP